METKKYQLPREFATKWVEALRNTPEEKHIKGEYYNSNTGCMCGMGVGLIANDYKVDCDSFDTKHKPFFNFFPLDLKADIINLNDDSGLTFSEQAVWIE